MINVLSRTCLGFLVFLGVHFGGNRGFFEKSPRIIGRGRGIFVGNIYVT